jgi:hypothetical protein
VGPININTNPEFLKAIQQVYDNFLNSSEDKGPQEHIRK